MKSLLTKLNESNDINLYVVYKIKDNKVEFSPEIYKTFEDAGKAMQEMQGSASSDKVNIEELLYKN